MNAHEFIRTISEDQDGGMPVIETPPHLDDKQDEKIDTPKDYNVLIHNDDHTPFNVVVDVLNTVFGHPQHRAMAIMMAAHNSGKALVATMSKDMAETKALQAMELAGHSINPVTRQPVFLQFSTEEA